MFGVAGTTQLRPEKEYVHRYQIVSLHRVPYLLKLPSNNLLFYLSLNYLMSDGDEIMDPSTGDHTEYMNL